MSRTRTRDTRTVPCSSCQAPRSRYGTMKPGSVCRRCRTRKYGKTTWQYAQDTRAAKKERWRGWIEPTERPVLTGYTLGTMTKYGKVETRGIDQAGQRYYEFLVNGVAQRVPAEDVEAA